MGAMLIDHQREKLINLIIYFATHTKRFHKVKLFKLLYFLDFEHYSLTGRNVTGLDYYAWDNGPCPKDLHEEIDDPRSDMKESITFSSISYKNGDRLDIKPLKKFDPKHFSKRELRILEGLAEEYKNTLAKDMIEETHLENLPWHQIYNVQKNKYAHIPYELTLKRQEQEEMKQYIEGTRDFWQGYE